MARKGFRPERGHDRVPGGQDRFELSKIYGRRYDLRSERCYSRVLGAGGTRKIYATPVGEEEGERARRWWRERRAKAPGKRISTRAGARVR